MKVFCESFGGDRRQSQTRLEFPSPLLLPGYYPQVVRLDTGAVLSAGKDRCFAVPKGQARIAQRFNAGLTPKGRESRRDGRSPIPYRILQPSLRDLCAMRAVSRR